MRFILKNMKREQVLAALAYGFFLACTSVTLWGGYVRFLTGQVDPGSFMLEYFVRSATLPLSLAVSGLAAFYWPKARLWRSPILALGFFLAGSLLVALQHGGVVSSEWSLVVVGACFGWGSGIMFGALQEIVAAQKVFTAGIVVFAAAGISALLFFAVEVLPADAVPWMSLFVFVGAAVALTCAAWKCAPKVHPMFDTVPDQRRDRCREAVSELWRPLLCVAFSAFIVGIVRVGSASGGGSIGQTNESNMIGLLAASVALLATWRFLYERVTLMRLYQILFPLTSSLMVVSCARTARNQSLTPVLVYGTFASIVYASSLAGSVVGLFVGAGRGVGLAELSVVALVAVYALSVAMVAPHGRKAGSVKAASGEKLAPVVGAVGDSVTAGCAVAVERYGLSRREAEVLDLLAPGAYRLGGVHRSVSTFLPNANFASRKVLRAPLAICPAAQRNASRETFLHWISPVENTSF